MANARKAKMSVSFNNTDISDVVNKYLMSFSYTDNEEDEADDIQIRLEDRSGTWLQKWLQDFIEDASGRHYVTETKAATKKVNDTHAAFYNEIGKGASSYDAAICQAYLIALKILKGDIKVKTDATFETAVKTFQKKYSLGITGKCDKKTWAKLTATVKGKSISIYDYTFTATASIVIRKSTSDSARTVVKMPNGKSGVILDKPAKGWYKVKYDGNIGFAKANGIKLTSVAVSTKTTTSRKLKKTQITASISTTINGKKAAASCGLFELDDIKASGPPSTVVIKGISLAYSGIRSTEKDKSWKNTTLKGIAKEIAKKHGLGLLWDCGKDKKYTRVEQADQTDIALLKKLCQDVGYSLKIANNQIVIYDQAKYEAMEEIAEFTFGDESYIKWNFATGEGQTQYDMCEVKYTNPKTGKVIKGGAKTEEYKDRLAEAKKAKKKISTDEIEVLTIKNQKVASVAEANALAERRLKLANKFERQATLTVRGNPIFCAGMTIRLNGFGYWSGKYLISKAKHDISSGSGYTTTITLRKVDEVKKPSSEQSFRVGQTVNFKGGYHYTSTTAKKSTGGKRRAGKAKITKIAKNLKAAHPYKLQGGAYNKLSGKCNVNGWVSKGTFTK